MNLHARIVGESHRDEVWPATGGGREVWEGRALGRPLAPDAFRPEAAALAAIASGYEDARARIIAAPPASAPAVGTHPTVEITAPRWAPTVPVEIGSVLRRPPAVAATESPTPRRGLLGGLIARLGMLPVAAFGELPHG